MGKCNYSLFFTGTNANLAPANCALSHHPSEYNKCGQFTSDNDETSIGAVASTTLFKLNTIFPENEGAVATEDDQKWQSKQITPVAC